MLYIMRHTDSHPPKITLVALRRANYGSNDSSSFCIDLQYYVDLHFVPIVCSSRRFCTCRSVVVLADSKGCHLKHPTESFLEER